MKRTEPGDTEPGRDCWVLDLDGRILYIDPAGLALRGSERPEGIVGRLFEDLWPEEHRQAATGAIAQARSGAIGSMQAPLASPAGAGGWWDVTVTPVIGAGGNVAQLLAVSRGSSASRLEQQFLVGQQQVLEMIATGVRLEEVLTCLVQLIERHAAGMLCTVLLLDDDGIHVRHGAAPSLPREFAEAVDGSPIGPRAGSCGTAMYLGQTVVVTDIGSDALWANHRDLAVAQGLRACWSAPILCSQKKVLGSFAMYYRAPRGPSPEELRLIETAARMASIAIEHQRSQEALRRSEERHRATLRALPDLMFVLSADGVFLDYHVRDTSDLLAPPEAFLNKRMHDVLPPALAESFRRAFERTLATNEPERLEYSLEMHGHPRFYEARVVRCDGDKILSIVRDITDQRRAELDAAAHRQELAHLNRVAMLGEISGALAHELSQPLTAVLANAQAARRLLEHDPLDKRELIAALDDVITNDKRAGAIIDRLRTLLRKGDISRKPVNLNDMTREVLDLAHGDLLARGVSTSTRFAAENTLVLGDRVQLQQVVLNLVLNACDAMSSTQPAERRLEVATAVADGFAEVAVSDRGVGIRQDQLALIFEPFVTFREQGLGLGLAISRSIVVAHQGRIVAENNVDRGATFRCFLPLAGGAGAG